MSSWDPRVVLAQLKSGDAFVDPLDAVRLLDAAGFVLEGEEGTRRIFAHATTGELVYLRMDAPVPPVVGPVIAEKIEHYWS